jgi:alpha-L-rhamnosidase
VALTATATYYHDVDVLAKIARILGNDKDVEQFTAQLTPIRDSYNKTFYHSDTHQYATASQTANAISLEMGLAPPEDRAAILQNIVNDVRSRQNSLTAGDVGFRYLVRALANGGRSDVVYDMNSRSDRPGYGYQLAHGATSLTESWDARSGVSQDHFMLGHIMDWFYTNLAGLGCADDAVGFNHIVIKPAVVGDVTWAKATYQSVRGAIASSWHKSDSEFHLDVQIPPGSTATAYIPASAEDRVREGNDSASSAKGVKFLRVEGGSAIFAVQSGSYSFTSTN